MWKYTCILLQLAMLSLAVSCGSLSTDLNNSDLVALDKDKKDKKAKKIKKAKLYERFSSRHEFR